MKSISKFIIAMLLAVMALGGLAAVPTSMSDLNTSISSNSPAGTDVIGTTLDDFFRAQAGILRRESAKGSNIASASTISLPNDGAYFEVSGAVTITGIANSWQGRRVYLRFTGAPQLTHNATSFNLPGGANIVAKAGDIGEFVQDGSGVGNWYCIAFHRREFAPASQVLATATASSSATIDFDITPHLAYFTAFEVHIAALVPVTNDTDLWVRLARSGVYVTTGYDFAFSAVNDNPTASDVGNGTGTVAIVLSTAVGNVTNQSLNSRVFLHDPAATTARKMIEQNTVFKSSSGNFVRVMGGGHLDDSNSAVDGIRFMMSSGNISSGKFTLIGHR